MRLGFQQFCDGVGASVEPRPICLPVPASAGGLLRLKPALEARLGPAQREALLCSYAACAMLAGKNDVAKEAVRWVVRYWVEEKTVEAVKVAIRHCPVFCAGSVHFDSCAQMPCCRHYEKTLLTPFPCLPCRSIDKQLSGSPAAAMLQASLLSREGKGKEADAVLAALAGGDAAQAAEAALMRAQLAAASGDAAGALKHLEVSGGWLTLRGCRASRTPRGRHAPRSLPPKLQSRPTCCLMFGCSPLFLAEHPGRGLAGAARGPCHQDCPARQFRTGGPGSSHAEQRPAALAGRCAPGWLLVVQEQASCKRSHPRSLVGSPTCIHFFGCHGCCLGWMA